MTNLTSNLTGMRPQLGIIVDASVDEIYQWKIVSNSKDFKELLLSLFNLWLWPLTTKHKDHHNAIGELVNTCVVFGIGYHHLWWHVGRGAWSLCHASDSMRSQAEDPGHTQIRDLGRHVGGEEDIVGREISMNNGRSLAVEVAQAQSHIVKDGVADLLWENAVLLNAGGEVGGEKLHD